MSDKITQEIKENILITEALIAKINGDCSINFSSDQLNIIKKISGDKRTSIIENTDFIIQDNTIRLNITPKLKIDDVTTLLFIHKKTSFHEKVLGNLISSIKHGKLYVYCYLDNLKNFLEFSNIDNIEFLSLPDDNSVYTHM